MKLTVGDDWLYDKIEDALGPDYWAIFVELLDEERNNAYNRGYTAGYDDGRNKK